MNQNDSQQQVPPGYVPPQAPAVSHSPTGIDEKSGERHITSQSPNDGPVKLYCPHCKDNVLVKVEKQLTSDGKAMAILGCCIFTPLMCYVMLSDHYKEGVYHCVNCNTEVGKTVLKTQPDKL
ncbi:hypothetical protein IWW48_000478 [Coemansia sp. RSA 1200]|nr:hypothetical protein IWW48_000478 [Coemansia sp. RSA 1200]